MSAKHTLVVRHLGGRRFTVVSPIDDTTSAPVDLEPPSRRRVEGRSESNLLQDLRWYLDSLLDLQLESPTRLADSILSALNQWGRESFAKLFANEALRWYESRRKAGLEHLNLTVVSGDPRILAWPWEALCDSRGTTLAHVCRLERQLDGRHDPLPLPQCLPTNQLNVLLIIARAQGDDLGFQQMAGPLVEWVRASSAGMQIDVLRPPTLAALQARLEACPSRYHIVHFDGHGEYSSQGATDRACGSLVFENEHCEPSMVSGAQLAALLAKHHVPIVVLSACDSARVDLEACDPFAATTAALLEKGIRNVVGMGYKLKVRGERQFMLAFYRVLARTGDVSEAVRAGRKAMLKYSYRPGADGESSLQDWLVPALYLQGSVTLPAAPAKAAELLPLPQQAQQFGSHGCIGRQDAIHTLERALLHAPPAILIHGLAGVGKTTLVKGWLHWLQLTGGLGPAGGQPVFADVLWLGGSGVRGTEAIIQQLIERCVDASATPSAPRLPQLIAVLREQARLLIWDDFECVEADRFLLEDLLQQLSGGRSKVLIVSRCSESWLSPAAASRLPLTGLSETGVWNLGNVVMRAAGSSLEWADTDVQSLLAALDGHPLLLCSVLPRLAKIPAKQLLADLHHALLPTDFGCVAGFAPVLEIIGLHRRHIVLAQVAEMLGHELVRQCFDALERDGLLSQTVSGTYGMHPGLHGLLSRAHAAQEHTIGQFIACMARYADELAPLELREQLAHFVRHKDNFQHALALVAQRACLPDPAVAQSSGDLGNAMGPLAAIAARMSAEQQLRLADDYHRKGRKSREYGDCAAAEHWLLKALTIREQHGDEPGAAATCHLLGRGAEEQSDFAAAERWFSKALAIKERQGDACDAARIRYWLGVVAREQRDLVAAARWLSESLAVDAKEGNEIGAANTYCQLALIARDQGDCAAAERWYLQALAIEERRMDECDVASTCFELGKLALERHDCALAERWYLKVLAIKEQQGDELRVGKMHFHLAKLAHEQQRSFAAAEQRYLKALAIEEREGDERGVAITCFQLGLVTYEQRDFAVAESWFSKALAIENSQGNEREAASTMHWLGAVAQAQGRFAAAEGWYVKSLAIDERYGDEPNAASTWSQLGSLAQEQRNFAAAEQWFLRALVVEEQQGHERDVAGTCYQLGRIAHAQRDFAMAERWYLKSLAIEERLGYEHGAALTRHQLSRVCFAQHRHVAGGEWFSKTLAAFAKQQSASDRDIVSRCLAATLRSAPASVQPLLRERCKSLGLDQLLAVADS